MRLLAVIVAIICLIGCRKYYLPSLHNVPIKISSEVDSAVYFGEQCLCYSCNCSTQDEQDITAYEDGHVWVGPPHWVDSCIIVYLDSKGTGQRNFNWTEILKTKIK